MPLLWIPVHSSAKWTTPPAPPRVVRAAIKGSGWLVATEVAGGWSVTFVPDSNAADPVDETPFESFQAAKVDWSPSATTHHGEPRASTPEGEETPPARSKSATKRRR